MFACGNDAATQTAHAKEPVTTQASPDVTRVCSTSCSKRLECAPDASGNAKCVEVCTSEKKVRRVDGLRTDAVDKLVACIAASTCTDGRTRADDLGACEKAMAKELPASPKADDTCTKLDALAARCGATPMKGCTEKLKLAKDDVLDTLVACTKNEDCRSAKTCLHDVRDNLDGD